MSEPKSNKQLYSEMVKMMMMDFVVNDFSTTDLVEKYNLSIKAVLTIINQHDFKGKRASYHDKLLTKSIDKLATRQATIYSRITGILERQVERIEQLQRKNPEKLIDSNRMKEVLAAFALVAKEYRLDSDKPTDNSNITIKVDMGSTPVISENHIINAGKPDIVVEPQPEKISPPEEQVQVVVETAEKPKDKEDDFVFGSL